MGFQRGKPNSETPGFSGQAWARNVKLYEAIRTMPFNMELATAELSEARFRHYITQDAHYLIGFGRALAIAAAKAPNPDRIVQFAKGAEVAIVVERALHGSFFQQFAITQETFAQTPLSPTCHHYVSYFTATAYAEPYEVVLGALLPCFWIYAEVGREIHTRAVNPNPYQAWIDTYAGDHALVAGRRLDDNAHMLLRLSKGAKGMLWCSQIAAGNDNNLRIRVFGEKGGLEWRQEEPNKLLVTSLGEAPRQIRRNGAGVDEGSRAASRLPPGHPEGYLEGFAQLYTDIAEQISARIEGRKPNPLSFQVPTVIDGVRGVRFIEAAVRSSTKGATWVRL